jgi:RecA-family ATPase
MNAHTANPPLVSADDFEREVASELAPKFKRVINPAEWEGNSSPARKWIIHDVIPDETVSLFFGDGATGKSLLALQLAAARSIGTEWLGLSPRAGRTLVLSAEDESEEMRRRLDDIRKSYDAAWTDLSDVRLVDLVGEDSVLGELAKGRIAPTPMYQALDDYTGEFKPSLVILDVLSDLFAGDENNRPQAREFIGLLKRLARKHTCAILLLAHPSVSGMTSGAGTSGSTAWNNSARGRMYLSRVLVEGVEPNKNLRKFEVKKANYAPASLSITVEWSSGVFVLASAHLSLDKLALEAKAERVLLDLLAEFERQDRDVSPNRSATYAPTEFAKHPDADGISKAAFEAALNRLLKTKRIRIETFGPKSHERKRLRVKPAEPTEEACGF